MLSLRPLKVTVLALNRILIQWSIDSTDDDLSKFRFTLKRSNSPEGPFDRIAPDFTNVFQFIDETEQMKSNWRKIYYSLTVTDVRNQETLLSPVASPEDLPDAFLLEIRRRNDLYLRRFVGVPAGILIQKTFGQRCGSCYDQIKSRLKSSKCLACYGAGFLGGYFPQINFPLASSPSPELVAILETGEKQPNQTNFWTGFYPAISPRDIIVEFRDQHRWRVVTVGKTERLRVRSRQIMSVVEINRNDVEYEIPITPWEFPKETFLGFRQPDGSGLL